MDYLNEYSINYLPLGITLFFVFCIGTIIGSFLNVVILRAFSGESIVLPPSKCPKCGNRLKWWHNIPILSYILLGGKCYFCKEKISVQYPIIEFITGVLFVIVFMRYGIKIDTLFALAVTAILIVLSVTDIKEKVVFDGHTYSLIIVGLLYNFYLTGTEVYNQINTIVGFPSSPVWFATNPLTNSLLGIILGVLIMEVAARIGNVIAGNRAFGEGDTYIAAGLGAFFGWKPLLFILVLSVAIQIVLILPIFLRKQWLKKNYVTAISLVIFFIYACIYAALIFHTSVFDNIIIWSVSFAILTLLAGFACINIIKGLKNRDELTFLPFGPALALAGLIILIMNFNFAFG